MTATPTAADYAWLSERHPHLMVAYCVTLVRGLTAEELLQRLGAEPSVHVTGVEALSEPSYEPREPYRAFVGATSVDGWALMVEFNGFLGVTEQAMLPVSRGRTVVSHFCNVNAVDDFCWFEDGEVRLRFQPLFAHDRYGSHADAFLTEMRESGFDLSEDEDRFTDDHIGASFALAHRLTGIHLTPELFAAAEFVAGPAPFPHD